MGVAALSTGVAPLERRTSGQLGLHRSHACRVDADRIASGVEGEVAGRIDLGSCYRPRACVQLRDEGVVKFACYIFRISLLRATGSPGRSAVSPAGNV